MGKKNQVQNLLVKEFPHILVAITRPLDESFPSDDVILTDNAYIYIAS